MNFDPTKMKIPLLLPLVAVAALCASCSTTHEVCPTTPAPKTGYVDFVFQERPGSMWFIKGVGRLDGGRSLPTRSGQHSNLVYRLAKKPHNYGVEVLLRKTRIPFKQESIFTHFEVPVRDGMVTTVFLTAGSLVEGVVAKGGAQYEDTTFRSPIAGGYQVATTVRTTKITPAKYGVGVEIVVAVKEPVPFRPITEMGYSNATK